MAKKSAKSEAGGDAGKGVSKSKAIREYMAANPSAGPSAVAQALTAQGVKVSAAFVSTVKSTSKKKKGRRGRPKGRRGRPPGVKAAATGDQFTVSQLLQAKRLAEQMGGIEKARAAIDAISRLA